MGSWIVHAGCRRPSSQSRSVRVSGRPLRPSTRRSLVSRPWMSTTARRGAAVRPCPSAGVVCRPERSVCWCSDPVEGRRRGTCQHLVVGRYPRSQACRPHLEHNDRARRSSRGARIHRDRQECLSGVVGVEHDRTTRIPADEESVGPPPKRRWFERRFRCSGGWRIGSDRSRFRRIRVSALSRSPVWRERPQADPGTSHRSPRGRLARPFASLDPIRTRSRRL